MSTAITRLLDRAGYSRALFPNGLTYAEQSDLVRLIADREAKTEDQIYRELEAQ